MPDVLPGVSLARCTPPEVKAQFLPRERLLKILEAPAPFALIIIAPAGYGKTVLAAQWAARHPESTVWYSIAPDDSPRDTFFHHIQSFRRLIPDFAPWAEEFKAGEFRWEEATQNFANEIAKQKKTFHMVFDGAENLSPEHTAMNQLWTNIAPTNIRTLTTRSNAPVVSFNRAVSLDVLRVINAGDLAFTSDEIKNFAQIMDIDISDSNNMSALESVHGWPAGVHIVLRSILDQRPIDVKDILSGANFDGRVLVEHAVNSLSNADRKLLTELSLFSELTAERVNSFTGDFGSMHRLREMAQSGLFVSSSRGGANEFEINPMIRSFFRDELRKDKKQHEEKSRLAAQILLEEGDASAAVHLYLEIGARDEAAKIVNKYSRRMIYTSDVESLRAWNKLVGSVLDVGETGQKLADTYASMLGDPLTKFRSEYLGFVLESKATGIYDEIAGDIAIMNCRLEFSVGDFKSCIQTANSVANLKMVQPDIRTIKLINAARWGAWSAFLQEDTESTLKIRDFVQSLPTPTDGLPVMGLPAIEAMVALAEGRYKDAGEIAQYVLDSSEKFGYAGVFSAYDAAYVLAEVNREFANEDAGISILDKYLPLAEKSELFPWVAAFNAKYARLLQQKNLVGEAFARLKVARDVVSNPLFNSEISYIVDEQELFMRLGLRDFERMNELFYRLGDTPSVVAVNALISGKKNNQNSSGLLAELPNTTIREKLNRELVAAELTLARPNVALEHIKKAVELAMPHGQRQIFLNRSSEFQTLFLEYAQSHPSIFVEQLVSQIRGKLNISFNTMSGLESPLTKRELDILRRLATGLPISQIAASIHISNNTIKTHLKSVYKKLEVDSREAAVAKGKELLLLS